MDTKSTEYTDTNTKPTESTDTIEVLTLKRQMELTNKERTIAILALQEICHYLRELPAKDENLVLAYATAINALDLIGEL